MKKVKEMRSEYDFTSGQRGKYADQYAEGTNVVLLDPDVAKVFHDGKQINDILRALIPSLKSKSKDGKSPSA